MTCDPAVVGRRLQLVLVLAATLAAGAGAGNAASSGVTFAISDDAAQRAFPSELAQAHAAGFGAARAYVGWADVATTRPSRPRDPADPAYDWAQTDADVARYGKAGLAVWIAFWHTPAWASGSKDPAVWPADPHDLGDFAYAVAKRYPKVKVFLDWNEPNLRLYAKPNTIAAYEPMARAVYAGVKAADPGAEVIGGNLARYRDNGRDPVAWATALRADGVPLDAFGIHPYPEVAASLASRSPRTRIDLFDVPALERIVGVPVAVTEFGWSSRDAGLQNQADWTAQAIDVARCTPDLAQFVFWGFHDHPVPAGQQADPWVQYGWVDADGAAKPVYAEGHAALAGQPDCSAIGQEAGAPAGWPDTNTIPLANTAPVCSDLALSTDAGTPVTGALACTDAEHDPLTYHVNTSPANGSITLTGPTISYTPAPGFAGTDAFALYAGDGLLSAPITVTVSVAPPAPPPIAPVPEPPAPPVPSTPVIPAAIAPLTILRSAAASVRGAATLARGVVSIELACPGSARDCTGDVSLSALLHGTRRSLGHRAVSFRPGRDGRIRISLPTASRQRLRALAGRTITIRVAFRTAQRTTTSEVRLRLPSGPQSV